MAFVSNQSGGMDGELFSSGRYLQSLLLCAMGSYFFSRERGVTLSHCTVPCSSGAMRLQSLSPALSTSGGRLTFASGWDSRAGLGCLPEWRSGEREGQLKMG